jgi:hypothetical protein
MKMFKERHVWFVMRFVDERAFGLRICSIMTVDCENSKLGRF